MSTSVWDDNKIPSTIVNKFSKESKDDFTHSLSFSYVCLSPLLVHACNDNSGSSYFCRWASREGEKKRQFIEFCNWGKQFYRNLFGIGWEAEKPIVAIVKRFKYFLKKCTMNCTRAEERSCWLKSYTKLHRRFICIKFNLYFWMAQSAGRKISFETLPTTIFYQGHESNLIQILHKPKASSH